VTDEKWAGRICIMCNGTGIHHILDPDTPPMTTTRRDIATNLNCPTCNGHGREPADD